MVKKKISKKREFDTTKQKGTGKQRLQKFLASAGVDSRRNCEELILDGYVKVNRKVVDTLPAFVDPEVDVVTVNGRRVKIADKVYFLLNKPKGVICTNSDPQGRRKAIDLIDTRQRIFCVGRLDIDTTGLIILTNDSELANRLTHPRYELPKTYEVMLKERISGDAIEKLKKGTWLSEGKTGRSAVKVLKRTHKDSTIEITIRQGLNRQIRRMLAKVDCRVKSLRRTKVGNITLKGIPIGSYKELTKSQVAYLKSMTE
ncbi:MAG: rRNA pseudouridine synthase [Planctomycetes bacterium]|nr:rRNA pseudouridine synthase [Planctomycetota bacterium]